MAIYQATNVTPDLVSGAANGVILTGQMYVDVSWQVNGNSPLLAYRIQFFQNNAASTPGTDTGKVVLDEPFYPVTGEGEQRRFSVSLPYGSSGTYFTCALLNAENEGKIIITQWWGATDAQSVVQRSASVFRVSGPTTATVPDPTYQNSVFSFNATVTLPDYATYGEVSVLWHQWRVIRVDYTQYPTAYIEAQTSGVIWGAASYEWTANPLPPGEYYGEFTCETSNGEKIRRETNEFYPLYSQIGIDLSASATVECDRKNGAVHLDFENIADQTINGNPGGLTYSATGSYPETWHFTGGPSDSAVWYLPSFSGGDGNWGFIWEGYLSEYTGAALRITLRNGQTVSFGIGPDSEYYDAPILDPAVTTDTPDHFFIGSAAHLSYTFWTVNGTTCFWQLAASYSWTHSPAQGTFINSPPVKVEFFSPLMTRKFYLVYGNTGVNEMSSYVGKPSPEIPSDWGCPVMSLDEYRGPNLGYYPFGSDFFAGQVAPVVREDKDSGEYDVIAQFANVDGAGNFYDYAALNGHEYNYYLAYQLHDSSETVMAKIGSAKPCFWSWALIEAIFSNLRKQYEVQNVYFFGNNFSSGADGNGAAPAIQPTFTPYPLVQKDVTNRHSGTLASLIGAITAPGVYADDNATRDAIRALTSTTNSLLLRDRRGDLWLVDIAGEISCSVADNVLSQPVTASVPWVEIGPVQGSVIKRGYETP